jgi:hypothetical protein
MQTTERAPRSARRAVRLPGRRTWLLAAIVAILAASAALVLVLTDGGDDEGGAAPESPREVSIAELRSAAAEAGHPVYWAGAIAGRRLELTQTGPGNIYVRYLPAGARVGDERPAFTAIGSYPVADAYRTTELSGQRRGAIERDAPGGGIAVWNRDSPTSVYLAYPGSDVLVEVYDPDPARARELALSGEVGPIR